MHNPLAREGNFCDENGNALKPQILQGCNQHMWYIDKGDRMTNRKNQMIILLCRQIKVVFLQGRFGYNDENQNLCFCQHNDRIN
jgi:hypothetical protein